MSLPLSLCCVIKVVQVRVIEVVVVVVVVVTAVVVVVAVVVIVVLPFPLLCYQSDPGKMKATKLL